MADVVIRLMIPYDEIKKKIHISREELKKRYEIKIQKELENFLRCATDTTLAAERYYQVCLILANIKVYNWKKSNNLDPGKDNQINLMALTEKEFEEILKETNSYFSRNTGALQEKDFDLENDFILYHNNLKP